MAEVKKKKKRLSEIAYEQIKESIISNEFKQGMMLSEKNCART